jgi:hypothetical protein
MLEVPIDQFQQHEAIVMIEMDFGFRMRDCGRSDELFVIDHHQPDFPARIQLDFRGQSELVLDLRPDLWERKQAFLDGQDDVCFGFQMDYFQGKRVGLEAIAIAG